MSQILPLPLRQGAGGGGDAGHARPPPSNPLPQGEGEESRHMILNRASLMTLMLVLGGAVLLAVLNLATDPSASLHVPTYVVALAGKYLCFAMLALAVDLVWGFAGILSLGHAAFFALGGYAMGMYLMRQIGARGVYGNANLPDFMVFLGWNELPWYWHGFEWFGFAALMVVLVPGHAGAGVRLAGVSLARHRRVSVDHHPGADLCAAAGVLPQRHGLRRQQRDDRLQGHPGLPRAGRDHALRAAGDHRAVPVRRSSCWRAGW